ncbi:Ig-like domain-containing protein, partial [Pseudomonas sp. GCM10022188]|uniref:Ig-like domain-containing protein n=1 Tax=Pseudomonas TaxID=286 RepID=UPI001E564B35
MGDNKTPINVTGSESTTPDAPSSRLVKRSPRPMALEQRFVFDGAAAADVADAADKPGTTATTDHAVADTASSQSASELVAAYAPADQQAAAPADGDGSAAASSASTLVDVGLFQTSEENATLSEAADTASQRIASYLQQASDEQLFTLFNGGESNPDADWTSTLEQLRTDIASGNLDIQVRLLDSSEMNGAIAAYSADGADGQPVIFVNGDWLEILGSDGMASILVEEYGHHIDQLLNGDQDTAGDEGQRFAVQARGSDNASLGNDDDHAILEVDGESLEVELAQYTFVNAYAVNTATTEAGKESNTHDFLYTGTTVSVTIDDSNFNSKLFSGNDVSATALQINGVDYYGWLSRPIKVQGEVVGFYFWYDAQFTNLATAQADGNMDGDSNVADNNAFILVVDQAYFDSLAVIGTSGGYSLKNIGSSSDRVDKALNELLANAAPVAVSDSGTATEDGGLNNAVSGSDATGNVLTNDTDSNLNDTKKVTLAGTSSASQSVATSTTSANGTVVTGQYGTLTIGADGSYKYVVNDSNTTVEALRGTSNTLTDTFTYTMADSEGATATTTLTITIQGANDTPVAASDYNSAKESIAASNNYTASDTSGSTATGNVLSNDTDKDSGDTKTVTGSTITGSATGSTVSYTTLTFATTSMPSVSTADYVFLDLDNTDDDKRTAGVTALYQGATQLKVGSIVTSGSNTIITLTGKVDNLTPTVGKIYGFSNSTTAASGYKDSALVATATQGSTTVTFSGGYTGTVAAGMTVSGTGVPAGTTVSSVTYDGSGNVTGVVLSQSVALSSTSLTFTATTSAGTTMTGQYGTLVMQADGSYTYTPTANNAALASGQTGQEAFTYTMQDASGATSTATLYITVTGSGSSDPNAVADTATAVEAGGVANATAGTNPTGNLLGNDTTPAGSNSIVSARASSSASTTTVTAGGSNVTITGQYGTLTLNSSGTYTYTVDNSNATVQALHGSSNTLTETFVYTVQNTAGFKDSATLTITVQGANDAPVAGNDSASATEAGGVVNAISGYNPSGNVLSNDSDVDDLASALKVTAVRTGSTEGSGTAGTVGTALVGTYGSLTLNADGTWSYVVNQSNAAVAALNAGSSLTESFNYTVTDSSGSGLSDTAVLTITINGATDTVAVNSVFVNEGSPYATFTVTGATGTQVTLALSSSTGIPSGDTTATLGTDTAATSTLQYWNGSSWQTYSGAVTIPAGDALYVRIAISNDGVHEGNETFSLTATSSGGSATGLATINDEGEGDVFLSTNNTGTANVSGDSGYPSSLDDDRPTISVSSPTLTEGGSAQFTVSINKTSTQNISFTPQLISGTATVGTDTAASNTLQVSTNGGTSWSTVSGPVTIAAGQTSVLLRIATTDDAVVESAETFSLSTGAISGTVTNADGATGTAIVNDNDSSNSPPDAVDDSFTVNEDSGATVLNVLGNDSTAPDTGETLTVIAVTQPATGGSVSLVGGVVSFTPDADWHGTTSFTYTVSDGNGGGDTATVNVTVTPLNDAPDAVDDSFTVSEDSGTTVLNVRANDSISPDSGETLTVTAVTQPAVGGSVSLVGGVVSFTPTANWHGTTSFTYTVSDGNGGSDTATVSVTVTPANDDFGDASETLTVAEDSAATTGNLLSGSSSVDGPLAIASFSIAGETGPFVLGTAYVISGKGEITVNADGSYSFTPAADFNGSFPVVTYTVTDGSGSDDTSTLTITVTPANDDFSDASETLTVAEDSGVTNGSLLTGSSSVDGPLSIASFSIAGETGPFVLGSTYVVTGKGTLTVNADGSYSFTPAADFNGSFPVISYTVTDGSGTDDTSTLTIAVTPANDDFSDADETVSVAEDSGVTNGSLLSGSSSVDGALSIASFSIAGETGPFVLGTAYAVSGKGEITVNADGSYSFTPATDFNGNLPVVSYTVTDGSGTDNSSTLTITVTPANDDFSDASETLTVAEDSTATTGTLLSGSSSVDGALSIASFSIAGETGPFVLGSAYVVSGKGEITVNADGSYSFTPAADFNGSFPVVTYTVTDGSGTDDSSTLTITVTPANDDFADADETLTVAEDSTATTGNLLTGSSSVDGPLSIASFTLAGETGPFVLGTAYMVAGKGELTVNADGSYSFTPAADFNGSFPVVTYTVTDGSGSDDTSTLTIAVTPANDDFGDASETLTVAEDSTATTGSLLTGSSSVDGALSIASFSIAGETGPFVLGSAYTVTGKGELTVNADGSYSFTPAADWNGSFPVVTYTVTDGSGSDDSSTLTIAVTPANDDFADADETLTVVEDSTATTGSLLSGSSSVDGPLSIASFTLAGEAGPFVLGSAYTVTGKGEITVNADGSYSFTPAADWNGSFPVISYVVTDGSGSDDTSTLTIAVTPANDDFADADETLTVAEDSTA